LCWPHDPHSQSPAQRARSFQATSPAHRYASTNQTRCPHIRTWAAAVRSGPRPDSSIVVLVLDHIAQILVPVRKALAAHLAAGAARRGAAASCCRATAAPGPRSLACTHAHELHTAGTRGPPERDVMQHACAVPLHGQTARNAWVHHICCARSARSAAQTHYSSLQTRERAVMSAWRCRATWGRRSGSTLSGTRNCWRRSRTSSRLRARGAWLSNPLAAKFIGCSLHK